MKTTDKKFNDLHIGVGEVWFKSGDREITRQEFYQGSNGKVYTMTGKEFDLQKLMDESIIEENWKDVFFRELKGGDKDEICN